MNPFIGIYRKTFLVYAHLSFYLTLSAPEKKAWVHEFQEHTGSTAVF